MKKYTEHYHFERDHQALNNELIEKPSGEPNMDGAVESQERLGGVLNILLSEGDCNGGLSIGTLRGTRRGCGTSSSHEP